MTKEEFDQPVRVAAVMRELLAAHDIVLTQPAIAERVLRLAPEPGRRMELFFDHHDAVEDLEAFHSRLLQINPGARVLMTVSPVPLAQRVVANMSSRQPRTASPFLRAAAQTMCRLREGCDYFPSREIITGARNRGAHFGEDCGRFDQAVWIM